MDSETNPEYFSAEELPTADEVAIRTAYQNAITDLTTIINYSNPTTAQVIAAVKRIAEIEKLELQYHKRSINNI